MAVSTLPAVARLPGEVIAYAGATAPAGWLLCDGALVSRTTYAALFAVIGHTYNYGAGNGGTGAAGSDPGNNQFYIPNIKGKVIVGVDAAQPEFDTLGEVGGSKDAVVAQHNHTGSTGARDLDHYHGDDHYHHDDHRHSDDHHHGDSGSIHRHPVGGNWGHVVGFRTDAAANGLHGGGERATFSDVGDSGQHWHHWKNNAGYGTTTNWKNEQGHGTTTNYKNQAGFGTTTNWPAHSNYAQNHAHTVTIDSNGVSATAANVQPYAALNYIIKV